MKPTVPILQTQIDAANRLHKRTEQFQIEQAALHKLRDKIKGWDGEASLLKCIAINALYATRVLAITRMAQHVSGILGSNSTNKLDKQSSIELVERIADLPSTNRKPNRKYVSFASKLCHIFIDSELFPIFDTVARQMLRVHLGRNSCKDDVHPYSAFQKNLQHLRGISKISATGDALDHYLWIAGNYRKFKKS